MNKEALTEKEIMALKQIRNYFLHNAEIPSLRELMKLMGYNSPRSAAILVNQLKSKGLLQAELNGKYKLIENPNEKMCAQTVEVPLIGIVSCGIPTLAEQKYETMVSVSQKLLSPGNKYYILRAKGDSMDHVGINDGDSVLIRQTVMANEGDIVVAFIDDEATIKEFHYTKDFVVLKPRSTNPIHKSIILTSDFQIQGVVVKTIPNM